MTSGIFCLILAGIVPALMALIIFEVQKKTKIRLHRGLSQFLIGLIFGCIAICGTEFGIPINGAQMNCRDASVLIAGLMFGGPAGITAGMIGGVERYAAVAWGVGTYTQVACSLSTVLAGLVAALLRKFMFEEKKPTWGMALATGISVEVMHMTMIFVTNLDDAINALKVVKACTIPMVFANGFSVMLASIVLSLAAHEKGFRFRKNRSETPVFETIQNALLIVVFVCLLASSLFVYRMEQGIAMRQTTTSMQEALSSASDELESQVDRFMIEMCRMVSADISDGDTLESLADWYHLTEIHVINSSGIITESTDSSLIGYDMASGDQSSEFLCLLKGETEYAQPFGPTSADPDIERKYVGIATENGGIVEIGIDQEGLDAQISEQIKNIATHRHVGTDGFLIVVNEDWDMVSASDDLPELHLSRDSIVQESTDAAPGIISSGDTAYYYMYNEEESYDICCLYPVEATEIQRDISVYIAIYQLIFVFVMLYLVLYIMIKQIVVKQIVKMADSLAMISEGNLNEVLDVDSSEEFASLSHDINRTVDTLKNYISEAAARIDAELEMATRIQTSVLPTTESINTRRHDLEIFASMDPAKEVGGDFYDFYFTDSEHFHVMIADVSGKGIPAAMFMMRAKSVLRNKTEQGDPIEDVFAQANDILCAGNDAEMFVTAWQGCMDLKSGLMHFVNAGHNPPVLKHTGGSFEFMKQKHSFILGGMEGIPYQKSEIQLQAGDILLLYTDGVVEATDSEQKLYGNDRLLRILNSQKFDSMEELLRMVRTDVDAFVGQAPQFDDLTMVAIRYYGPEGKPSGK